MAPAAHEEVEDLSAQYSEEMQQRMGANSLTYRHEDGMNYTRILDDLIVGSCLQTPADLDKCAPPRACPEAVARRPPHTAPLLHHHASQPARPPLLGTPNCRPPPRAAQDRGQ